MKQGLGGPGNSPPDTVGKLTNTGYESDMARNTNISDGSTAAKHMVVP